MDSNKPARRPVIRAVSFEEIGEAISRLLDIARSDTGQSQRVADFLLAWWNGDDLGHFPILHFCNCDPIIAEDMMAILAYLAQEPTIYANAWGYEAAMRALVEQKRDLDHRPLLEEAHAILAQGIDHLRFAAVRASSGTDQGKARDRLAGELHKLATLLAPDRRDQPEAKARIRAATKAAEAAMTALTRSL
jgi:hypothetical protein